VSRWTSLGKLVTTTLTGRVSTLALTYPDMMTKEVVDYFYVAQLYQDLGGTWGDSYDRAEASLTDK